MAQCRLFALAVVENRLSSWSPALVPHLVNIQQPEPSQQPEAQLCLLIDPCDTFMTSAV